MDGLTLSTDPDKCVACGACFKVCIYDGLKLVKGKSAHNMDNCVGCGRCVDVCPEGAISMHYDESTDINEVMKKIIERYENIVDISG
jgi:heterodisulfide reductase subunit A-like polyferredoxin